MNTSNKELVETLTRSKLYREYAAAFRDAVGLPVALTPVESWNLPLHEDKNESPFCRLMAGTNKTCAACLRRQDDLRKQATDQVSTMVCFSGLRDSAIPVKLGGELVGYLHTGQVFTEEPTIENFENTVERLREWGIEPELSELRDAYFSCRVISPTQYQAILSLLRQFAEQLASMGNQVLVADESAENPQIKRVRDYISENMDEDICLSDCARMAHMSTFYFCKTFKRTTGLSFTDYLSRLRAEQAKKRLLDPHVRVSEVAFEVGFQSLSQFNRVFKRVTGVSPTEFRRRLPAKVSTDRHSSTHRFRTTHHLAAAV